MTHTIKVNLVDQLTDQSINQPTHHPTIQSSNQSSNYAVFFVSSPSNFLATYLGKGSKGGWFFADASRKMGILDIDGSRGKRGDFLTR